MFLSIAHAQSDNTEDAAQESSIFSIDQIIEASQGILSYLIQGAGLIFIIFLFYLLANGVKRMVSYRLSKKYKYEAQQEIVILAERATFVGVFTLGCVIAFEFFNVDAAWILGAASVGLGFAFKDILSNLLAGVMILTQSQIKIGDLIKINDQFGKIIGIDMRTTQLKTFDGTEITVPNADLIVNHFENFTAQTHRRISFDVGIHYNTPIGDAITLINKVIGTHSKVLKSPSPAVLATSFGDSAINLSVRFWIDNDENWFLIRSELIQRIKIAFDQNGIVIPFPMRTLTIDPYDKNLRDSLNVPKKPSEVLLGF